MTNGEKLRTATDEEAAKMIAKQMWCASFNGEKCNMKGCIPCIMEWMQKEKGEEDNG